MREPAPDTAEQTSSDHASQQRWRRGAWIEGNRIERLTEAKLRVEANSPAKFLDCLLHVLAIPIMRGPQQAGLSEYPEQSYGTLNRGKARRDIGDLDGSIADYTRAIEVNPHLSSAYFSRQLEWQAQTVPYF